MPRIGSICKPGLVATVFAGCIACACLFSEKLCGQETGEVQPQDSWQFRTELFQLLLEEQGLKSSNNLNDATRAPLRSVIVVVNDTSRRPAIAAEQLIRFVQQGGALLIAREIGAAEALPSVSAAGFGTFAKGPVFATEALDQYETFADCVRVKSVHDPDALIRGVSTIITNRSGWFAPGASSPFTWHTLAAFPETTRPRGSGQQALIAVGRPEAPSEGIAIVSADASLFTNGMLWHGDNAFLAIRLSEALRGEARDRMVFIANGQTLGSAAQRLASQLRDEQARAQLSSRPPEPALDRLLRLSNAVAKEVVDSNIVNEALRQQPRNLHPRRYFRLLIGMLIVAFILGIVWMLLTRRMLRTTWVARLRMKSAYEIQSGNEAGDHRQAAGYLAREFCHELTGSGHSVDWQNYLARLLASTPAINTSEQEELTRIVDIASRGCQERMNAPDLQRLGRTIAGLRAKKTTLSLETTKA